MFHRPFGLRAALVRSALSGALIFAALMPAGAAENTPAGAAAPAAGTVLVISDIHFDPMADPKLVDRLAEAEPGDWPAIFDAAADPSLGRYGKDSNWRLLRSALRQMKETLPDPAFTIIPGDFLSHGFRDAFDQSASDHSAAAYRVFVRKTMQFLAAQLELTFPATTILPAIGNNDEVCGDYQLEPNGPFLADTLPLLQALVGGNGKPGFDRDWTGYGNYSVSVGGVRVVFPNTVFFARNYKNACGPSGDPDPGKATLAWLGAELVAAKQAREHVWLVYHIPPGIDGYATLRRGSCPSIFVPMWDQVYARPFADLMRNYADTVAASFAGHTHMDDFRLIGDGGNYFAFALITPALSPIFGQNPAFRTMTYDLAGGILDQTTYDLTNLTAAAASSGPAPAWQAEYTFTKEWGLPRVDLPSLTRLYARITGIPADRDHWHKLYPVSSPVFWSITPGGPQHIPQAVHSYDCATGHVPMADYAQCYCGGTN